MVEQESRVPVIQGFDFSDEDMQDDNNVLSAVHESSNGGVVLETEIKGAAETLNLQDYRKLLFDELGNLTKAYEIARYEKQTETEEWFEIKRYDTLGRKVFVIDGMIYFLVDDRLLPMNMDFNSLECNACERVIREIPITHRITEIIDLHNFIREWISEVSGNTYTENLTVRAYYYNDSKPYYYLTHSGLDVICGGKGKTEFIINLGKKYKSSPKFIADIEKLMDMMDK